jgi:putative FmdB family regulatory protein
MPTYEYECSKCHHHFDAFQSMSSEKYETCPKELCQMKKWGKGKVKRLLGAGAGLIFKGSGFYITDYRSEGYKSSKEKDSAPAAPAKPVESKSTEKTKTSPAKEKKSSPKKG